MRTAILHLLLATCTVLAGLAGGCQANLTDTLAGSARHQRLSALLAQTGLDRTLVEPGPYTVLAPTDGAFAKLRRAERVALKADPAALTALLRRHIVVGSVSADQLAGRESLETLAGPIRVELRDGKPLLGERARVLSADLPANNGRIHILDEVLRP